MQTRKLKVSECCECACAQTQECKASQHGAHDKRRASHALVCVCVCVYACRFRKYFFFTHILHSCRNYSYLFEFLRAVVLMINIPMPAKRHNSSCSHAHPPQRAHIWLSTSTQSTTTTKKYTKYEKIFARKSAFRCCDCFRMCVVQMPLLCGWLCVCVCVVHM